MAGRLENLLRACTVRVVGPHPGTGFFIAPGKVLTCCHVISRDGTEAGVAADLTVVWERDGQSEVTFVVTGKPRVLQSRGRPIVALDSDYPDVAVLDVDAPAGHPCVQLDAERPGHRDKFQAYGYPKEGGSIGLTATSLGYRGTHGISPTAYLDLMSDTVKPGMSGAAVLNRRTGGVCGIIVATRNPQHPDGALAVPWAEIETDVGCVLAENRAFHDQDLRWAEAALEEPDTPSRVPDPVFRSDVRALLKVTAERAARSGLPPHLTPSGDVLRMARTVRVLGGVRRPGDDRRKSREAPAEDDSNSREAVYALPTERDKRPSAPPQPWEKVAAAHDRLVVLGDPGMGKSWLLRLEACRLAEAALGVPGGPALGRDATVPVLVRADVLAAAPGDTLAETVAGYLVKSRQLDKRSRARMVELIDAGGVVLLLDALDEVSRRALGEAGTAPRKRLEDLLAEWAEEQYRGRRRFIVASRLAGHTHLPVRDGVEAELLPFTRDDIDTAVKAWELPGSAGEWLRRQLGSPAVAGMARVPLLLALICSLAADPRQREEDLPATRADLYGQVVLQFLSGEHRAGERGGPISPVAQDSYLENLLGVLTHVAVTFADDSRGWIDRMPYRELEVAVRGAGNAFTDLGSTAGAVIDWLAEKTGILVPAGNPADRKQDHVFLFPHRTFAEYLVALRLRDIDAGRRMEIIARHQWFDPDWAEAIPMLGGLCGSDQGEKASALVRYFLAQDPDPLHYASRAALRVLGEAPDPDRLLTSEEKLRLACKVGRLFDDEATRGMLTRALAAVGAWPGLVTEVLLGRLTDNDPSVRRAAVEALAGQVGDEITAALVGQLADDTWSVCEMAIRALAGRAGDEVVAALLKWLTDGNSAVRSGAVAALGQVGDEATAPLLKQITHSDWYVRRAVVGVLAPRDGDEVTAALLVRLGDREPRVRKAAIKGLGGRDGDEIITALLGMLADGESDVREAAVAALAARAGDDVIAALLKRLTDGNPVVRSGAVAALAGRAGDEVTSALLERLIDDDQFVRRAASKAVGGRAGDEITAALVRQFTDGDWYEREATAAVLAARGGDKITAVLLELLTVASRVVRERAVEGLCGRAGDEVTSALLRRLTDGDWHVRGAAITALAGRAGDEITAALLKRLTDGDWHVRSRAVAAVGGRAGDEVTAALLKRLTDDITSISGVIPDKDWSYVTSALLRRLIDTDLSVRSRAVAAVGGRAGDEVTAALLKRLTDDHPVVRSVAVAAVGSRAGDEVTSTLLRRLTDDINPSVVGLAAVVLGGRAGDEVTAALLKRLTDDHPSVRRAAITAVGGRAGDEVTAALLKRLTDDHQNVRRAAITALGGRAGDKVTAALLGRLADDHPTVREVAMRALVRRDEVGILLKLSEADSWLSHPLHRRQRLELAASIADHSYQRIPPRERPWIRSQLARLTDPA